MHRTNYAESIHFRLTPCGTHAWILFSTVLCLVEFFFGVQLRIRDCLGQENPTVASIEKCLNLMEIRFNNFPTLRSVQLYIFYDTVIKIEPTNWSKISKDKSIFNVFLCTSIPTYHTSEVYKAVFAFQGFACDRERFILGGIDKHHFRFRQIYFAAVHGSQPSIPYRSYS